jgi:predicted lipid-binding transport protein (Tim44 family)
MTEEFQVHQVAKEFIDRLILPESQATAAATGAFVGAIAAGLVAGLFTGVLLLVGVGLKMLGAF